jgi:hypothetical protein
MSYSYDRTAASGDSLLSAKVDWAKTVAERASKRFESYGGWRTHQVKCSVRVSSQNAVELTVRSDKYKWTGLATFEMLGTPRVTASVNLDRNADQDILEMLEKFQDDVKTILITDTDSADDIVMQISLWFSRTVNQIQT